MVGKRHVAGKGATIEQQNFVTLARQQKGGGRTGTARTNDNRVIHGKFFPGRCPLRSEPGYQFSVALIIVPKMG